MRPTTVQPLPLSEVVDIPSLPQDVLVTGVCLHTQACRSGDIYVALPGAKTHGAKYIAEAITAGAVAVVTDQAGALLMTSRHPQIPVHVCEDPRSLAAKLASHIYGTDSNAPAMFGITGTNGKTTTSYFLYALLKLLKYKTGLLGTIETLLEDQAIPSVLTTPEAPDLHALLAVMKEKSVTAAVMEVSSHALEFQRVNHVRYAVVGFTNLTQDHLDLHGTMEEYYQKKASLFTLEHAQRAVICVDDTWGKRLAQETILPVTTVSVLGDTSADWTVTTCQKDAVGTTFILTGLEGKELSITVPLPGKFNVANAALAAIMALESGIELAVIQRALKDSNPFSQAVPGRMEVIAEKPLAIVDFAHNPEALTLALEAVRPQHADSKLIIVFGATGERDNFKRPAMGRVAAEGADIVIITDDDPHSEPAAPIRDQVAAGAIEAQKLRPQVQVLQLAPRAQAIKKAVELATDMDTILVAGRGHEKWQEVMGENLPLDDRQELRTAIEERFNLREEIAKL